MLYQQQLRRGSAVRSGMSKLARRVAFGIATMAACAPALGTPEFGQVVAGQASFRQFGPNMTITASNGAIINYWSFNIGPMESVRFVQPSSDSRVLNRITGPDPSVIAGRLTSNGIVYIMNPSGVYFRQGALVNVGQIYAGAARLSDADFLAGHNHFTDITGSVVNEGHISAQAAHLVGQTVSNPGTISAPGGIVTMVAGDDVLIGEAGGSVYVRVTSNGTPTTSATISRDSARVSNTGTINAAGGSTALVAGDVYGMAIFNGGNITARDIRVEGQGAGVVDVSGRLDASSTVPGERGGTIAVTGQHVRVQGATLDASGTAGGGRVMVGGDFQGGGNLRRAETTYVDQASTLRADGTGDGTAGGTVVSWSDGITGFYGTASARGGDGGAGGVIETSGLLYLDVRGAVIHAGAEDGVGGLWLLDPSDVTIQNAATANATFNAGNGAYTLDGDTAVVNAADISAALTAGANVTIHTNRAAGAQSGNITMVDSVTATNAGNVTFRLQAANNITINVGANITAGGAGAMRVELAANDVTTQGGAGDVDPSPTLGSVFANGNITTNGGDLVITNAAGSGANGIPGVTTSGTIDLGAGALMITTNSNAGSGGSITLGGPIMAGSVTTLSRLLNMSGGTVTTTGNQNYRFTTSSSIQGMTLNAGTTLTSTAGNIVIGQAGDLGTVRGANSLALSAAAGTITINSTIGSGASRPTTLSVTAPSIAFNSGISRTSAGQTWTGPVTLSANLVTFTATDLTFTSSLRGAVAGSTGIIVSATGLSTFGGDIGGGGGALSTIAMSGAGGTILFNNGTVTTTGLQQYINPVTLGADATFTGSGVQFLSNVDGMAAGQQSLTVMGDLLVSGSAGAGTSLEFLNVSGASTIEDAVVTAGAQTYGGAVTLGGTDGTNRAFQGSLITFNSTVNAQTAGSQGADFTGDVVFNGAVGGTAALGAITTMGGTTTVATSTITTAAGLNSGDQSYGGAVTLGTANDTIVTFNAGAGTVSFGGALNATTAGEQGVSITGNASFGAVGATTALSSVNVTGSTLIAGNITTTNAGGGTGNQTFGTDVDLGGAMDTVYTLMATGGLVSFGGSLDASTAGEQGLIVMGDASFGGAVGAGSALRSLSVSGASSFAGPIVMTSAAGGGTGAQTYTGAVTLNSGAGTTITFTGASVDFAGGVDAAAAGQQGLIVNGTATFGASSGTLAALRSLVINGAANLNAASIITSNVAGGTGSQLYSGAVTLGAATVGLTSTGGTVTFSSTVNAAVAGTQGLGIAGNVIFDGAVGNTAALGALTVSGTTAINGGSIATSNAGGGTGDQTYTGTVTIGGANGSTTTLTSTGGTVQFAGLVEALAAAQQGLAVAGAALFGGNVGGTNALRSLSVSGATQLTGGTTITTSNAAGGTGDQTYTGAVTLGGADDTRVTLISTGGTVGFGSTIDAMTAGEQSLAVTGNASFGGAVGSATAIGALSVSGTTSLGADVTTSNAGGASGNQTYSGAVTLASSSTLASTGGLVSFGSTVDATAAGDQGLTVTGNASFADSVGGVNALRFLSVSGDASVAGGSVSTTNATGGTGDQTWGGTLTLAGANGSTLTLMSTGGTVNIGTGLAATTAGQQSLAIMGDAAFNGTTTGTALSSISVSGATALNAATLAATDAGGGSGDITLTGAVTLGGANDTTSMLTSTGGTIAFASTIDATTLGEQSLTTVGNVTFGGNVGGTMALGALDVSGGTIMLPASVTTSSAGGASGNQSYATAIVLAGDTALTATGGTVMFGSTVDGTTGGMEDLTITGGASFAGAVGGTTALGTLSVSGATAINGGAITTQGMQTFTGAVTLGADTMLDAGAADIMFGSTINSADATARALTLNSTGATTFGGNVGTTFALSTLTTDAGGTTTINAATVTTSGAQTYGDDVVLGVDSTLNAASVAFAGNLDGTVASMQGLTVNTPMSLGAVSFGGTIGGTTPLEFLTLNGVLTLTADTTFVIDSISLANIQSMGGAWNLTLTCAVDATIGNTINLDMSAAVNNLLSNGAGTTTLLAGSTIRTTGTQTYSSASGTLIGGTVGQNVTLDAGGTVMFAGTIDSDAGGSRGLIVTTSGDTTFSDAIGLLAPLSRLQTNGGGTTNLGAGLILTDGATVIFDDAVVLTADTTIIDDGTGVFFNNTVDSDGTARDLTVIATSGAVTFGQSVGAISVLNALTVTADTTITLGSGNAGMFSVNTQSTTSFAGAISLLSDMVISTGAGNVTFIDAIDSFDATAHSLTVNSSGTTLFRSSIGATNALLTLETDAAGTTQLGNMSGGGAATINIFTSGTGITLNDTVRLGSGVSLNAGAGDVSFMSTVDSVGATAFALTVNSTGNTLFGDNVGATNVLSTLTTLGGPVTIGDGTGSLVVSTSGAQSFGGPVVARVGMGNTLTFTAAAGGVTFMQTLDAFAAGEDAVMITNAAIFSGDVGGTAALASLSVGDTASIAGNVTTTNAAGGTGDQTYSGAVTLAGADDSTRTLTSTGGTVNFGSSIDATGLGEQGLAIVGNAAFNGDVGGMMALADLTVSGTSAINTTSLFTTDAGGGTGNQSYIGAVTFGTGNDSTITFSAGMGTVAFGAAVDGAAAGEQSISIIGNAMFAGDVGGTMALGGLSVTGMTNFAGSQVVTTNANGGTGTQDFGGNFILNTGDDSMVTFTATGSSVNFNGGLSGTSAGEQSVTVMGDATIAGSTTVALGALNVTGNTTLGNGNIDTTTAGGGTGAQSYGSVTLTGAPGSTTTLNADGGTITLGLVDAQADNGQNLVVNATNGGMTLFNGDIGGTNALASLTVTGGASINTTFIRTTAAGGGTGDQTYNGMITFGTGNDSTITFSALMGGTVTFAGALDGQAAGEQTIAINGNAMFGGAIGMNTALAAISVAGTTTINGSTVVTTNAGGGTGDQTFTGAVTFTSGSGSTFTFDTTGGTVMFGSTLDGSGPGFEAVVVTGNASFGGIVGGINALASLSVSGTAAVNTTAINTTNVDGGTGNQTFMGLVTLGTPDDSTTTFSSTGGTVDFQAGLTGTTEGEQSAAIMGNASFAGMTATALGQLSVSGTTTLVNTTLLTSNAGGASGDQTFGGAVTLGGADDTLSTLTSTGGTVTFTNTVDATTAGEQGLVITGNAVFNNTVGATTALSSLGVSGTTLANTSAITTSNVGGGSGNQTYTGAVTLMSGGPEGVGGPTTTTFTSTGGFITFGSTLDASAAGAQTAAIVGNVQFTGAVGGINRLFRTTVTGTATVMHDVMTTMGQLFQGAVTLARDGMDNNGLSTFDGGSGQMVFMGDILGTVAGAQGILIRTDGTMRFENGVAVPNTFPTGDGQIAILRTYIAPIAIGSSQIGTDATPLRTVTFDTMRATTPAIATIIFSPSLTMAGRVPDTVDAAMLNATTFNIRATDTVRFGFRDKVLSFGTLNISGVAGNSLDSAQIGDITSLRGISITADQIAMQNRGIGPILGQSTGTPSNTIFNNDQGIDMIGTSIFLSVEPFFHNGDISAPTQIPTADVIAQRLLTFASPGAVGVNVPGYATVQDFGAGDLLLNFIDNGPLPSPGFRLPFDLRSQGPVNTSISNTIAAFVVVAPPDIQLDTTLGSALLAELQEINLFARTLEPDELIESLVGRALYDDRDFSVQSAGGKVSVGRLAADVVRALLSDFRDLKADRDTYKDAITEAYTLFLDTPEGAETPFNAAAFKAFVMRGGGDTTAAQAFAKLEAIFKSVDDLAIGPVETDACKRAIVEFVRPSEMTDTDLVRAVESQTPAPVN
ncbi:MAG: filamentous hemagglutinin N-terminal domain-containing protein [Phycisphaerales bacterium]